MEYICKLGTASGKVVNQTEEALSEAELRQRLAAAGFYVFSVEPRELLKSQLTRLRGGRVSADDFLVFNQQFLTLSKSGLPLQTSLDMLAKQTRSDELRIALEHVSAKVRAGALLSEAFDSTGQFPKIYSATLRAGERSGSLDKVLQQFVTYQKTSRTFRKKFYSALIYPAFLLVFLAGLISFLIAFVVPQFAKLYAELEVQLPLMTRIMIEFATSAKRLGGPLILGMVAFGLFMRGAWQSERVRIVGDKVRFRLPLLGSLLLKFSVAEFARTLGTLLQGGIPIVPALETARESVSSPLMARAIAHAQGEVTAGRTLSGSLRATGFFPPIAIDMLEVGEATGALPTMLDGVAEFFEEDVSIDLATLVALVDPIMIACIAVVVAFVLIAFYMPLFSMAAQVH
jgi:type IV pilus assembly protein PilC